MQESELDQIVRRVAGRALARCDPPGRVRGVHVATESEARPERPGSPAVPAAPGPRPGRAVVAADCLRGTPDGGTFAVPDGAAVTPLAEDEARRRGIRLLRGPLERSGRPGVLAIAVASDHGGFALKQAVLEWVREAGHRPVDLGTFDETPVDYPDQAARVAAAVAGGSCALGIAIDGAGIGSAIAANKVPGVRAATCWNEASARNAREHNFANVLALGARLLDAATARAAVRAFLSTPEGAARHARRVAKIEALERRFARPAGERTP